MLIQIYKKQQIVQFPWPSYFLHHGGMRRITRNRRVILSKFKKLLEFPIIKYIYQQKMIGTSTRPRRASNNANHRQIGQYSYSIKDVIGEGFSSKVYKGLDRTTQSQVAIKLINNDILTEPINKTLLDFELEILQLMKGCPNVLEMHEIIKQSQDTYIITEVCTTDLNKMLIPLLPLQEVEKYIDQLINGFNQFFTKEVIHRDLKPANLLIDTQGNLKIGDFGFAIKSSEARKQTKFNIGSPLYMAPQALKKNEYTHKSDIWSIGIIIYEMLTGDNPWKAENQQELYRKLDNTRIEQILAGESFPQHIKDLLMKTLQFERKHRITPQQLIKIKMPRTWIHRQQQQKLKKEQQKFGNSHYIPRTNKNTKTQKFVKVSKDCPATLHKTQKSIKDEPSNVTIRPVIRRPQYSVKNQQPQNSTLLSVPTYEKQRNSAAKTNGSTTIAPSENQGPKLTKQQAKAITKKLINYVHICRLLYKVLTRINQCIENSKNQFVVESLGNAKDNLFRLYCPIIVKHMHQVKNFASNNFLQLTPIELDDYVMCSQFKKLRKICGEYIQRYSKSNELKMLWIQIEQPDYSASIKETVKLISELWPELCQKNHNEIILLEFLVFTRQALQVLHDDKIDELCAKDDIEKYVDTIPNPPTMNRFKHAIIKAKKIGGEKKQWSVEVASNGLH